MEERVGTVAAIGRYPVKSMQGDSPEQVAVTAEGLVGDRRYGVVEEATGKVLSAKRWPALLQASARTAADGTVTVTLPHGPALAPGDPGLDAALSAFLDHAVAIRDASAPDAVSTAYEMALSCEDEDAVLIDVPMAPARYFDLAGAHLLTTSSIAAMAAADSGPRFELPRFRPSVLIDSDGEGFVEDAWVGKRVQAGTAVFDVFMLTMRCMMTTRAQLDLPADINVGKSLNRHHSGNLGVYCTIAEPGEVRIGDPVVVLG